MQKKFLSVLFVLFFLFALVIPSFASVGMQEDGTEEGTATEINISTGLNHSNDGSVSTITLDRSLDMYIRTSLLATGRINAFSSAASSSTQLTPSSLPWGVFYKYVGGNNSLDETDGGTKLPNGTPGQIIKFIIAELMTNGSWIITPNTSKTITTITMDTKGDAVTLIYLDDTLGWEDLDNTGCTIVRKTETGIPEKP